MEGWKIAKMLQKMQWFLVNKFIKKQHCQIHRMKEYENNVCCDFHMDTVYLYAKVSSLQNHVLKNY